MAASGFEGFEKRLELHFSGADPLGLRRLGLDALDGILDAVQCSIVSAVGNSRFDAYVLSESSLFVYPDRMIIKTCGTTQLLKSLPYLLAHTLCLGLHLSSCKYTRGSFIFPGAQPFPHTSFADEVAYLEASLPTSLCYRKACVMPPSKPEGPGSWHVYCAAAKVSPNEREAGRLTVEVCMTRLDRVLARRFFRQPGDGRTGHEAAATMTRSAGIDGACAPALICDYAFDPCGYSMNGLDGERYSTVHVTPEEGHSYASFECVVGRGEDVAEAVRKAAEVFRPAALSVSVGGEGIDEERVWAAAAEGMKPLGLHCRRRAAEEFPGGGTVTFQAFTVSRRK